MIRLSLPMVAACSTTLCLATGCATADRAGTYTTLTEPLHRDSLAAQRLNAEGLTAVETQDWDRAETAFRQALEADLWYGPAHNNLGLVLLQRTVAGEGGGNACYEAAWEFTWACRLMPQSVCPRHNLGLVLERSARLDGAIDSFRLALELGPDNIEVMGHLARAYVKMDRRDTTVRELLKEVAYRGPEGWDLWAREQLLRLDRQ